MLLGTAWRTVGEVVVGTALAPQRCPCGRADGAGWNGVRADGAGWTGVRAAVGAGCPRGPHGRRSSGYLRTVRVFVTDDEVAVAEPPYMTFTV